MTSTAKKNTDQPQDAASAEVQSRFDKEQAQGFVGIKADPTPNEAYSLLTGPDSPSHVPDILTRVPQSSLVDEPGKPNEVKEG